MASEKNFSLLIKGDSWGKRSLFFHLTLFCMCAILGPMPTLCDREGSWTEAKATGTEQSQKMERTSVAIPMSLSH